MTTEKIEATINKLQELGYYKFVPEGAIDQAKENTRKALAKNILVSDYDYDKFAPEKHILASLDRRLYAADAETLAEQGVKELLENMQDVLEKEGVNLGQIEENFNISGSYTIDINGEQFVIYSKEEEKNGEIWSLATKRTLELVNKLLEQAGSQERLYGISGGNDGQVIFLTPEIYEYTKSLNLTV